MFKKLKKGFTLMELLVIIAIMLLVFSITLTAIMKSRNKAYDTRVIKYLTDLRTYSLEYSLTNGNFDGLCTVTTDKSYKLFHDLAMNDGAGNGLCNGSGSQWFAYIQLKSDSARAYCVDYMMSAKSISYPVTLTAENTCP